MSLVLAVATASARAETPPTARESALREAEAALAQGRTAAAEAAFDRASRMLHSADTEMGQVRAAMQAGQYRRALAFSAHTAGGHGEASQAGVLYAWLLRAGGQRNLADEVLAKAALQDPADGLVAMARSALADDLPLARGALLQTPHRVGPDSWPAEVALPRRKRVAGSALLIDAGRRALVPMALLDNLAMRIWLRNGMGQTVVAWREDAARPGAAAMFRLQSALPFEAGDAASARLPFEGSPAFVAEYASSPSGDASWPWLRQGFLGGVARDGERRLGIDPAAGLHGGAVLDARGRVIGLALPGTREAGWLAAASAAEERYPGTAAVPNAGPGPVLPIALDEAYERLLRVTLQVVVER